MLKAGPPHWMAVKRITRYVRFDSSRAGYHLVLGFMLSVRYRLVAVWCMANM